MIVMEPLLSLTTTQGLATWEAARALWGLRCDAYFWAHSPSVAVLEFWSVGVLPRRPLFTEKK